MSKFGIIREFWSFLRVREKWRITPIPFPGWAWGDARIREWLGAGAVCRQFVLGRLSRTAGERVEP